MSTEQLSFFDLPPAEEPDPGLDAECEQMSPDVAESEAVDEIADDVADVEECSQLSTNVQEGQLALLDVVQDWERAWRSMPEYAQTDLRPLRSVTVHFATDEDAEEFSRRIGEQLTVKTRSLWFPGAERLGRLDKRVMTRKPVLPQWPLYIVSKGRADTRHTNRALARMGVHHYVVVEEQEREDYERECEMATILVLDEQYKRDYECFDELGLTKSPGPGPARNFAMDHSVSLGAKWHWVMDDNIDGFYRLNRNNKVPMETGAGFRAMEDFCLRYDNVAMAGPHYTMFAWRKAAYPAFLKNTRIYSCNLIYNEAGYRWRGRYNEDTDISLRMIKDGWRTILFYPFLQNKLATQTVQGGNTAEFYAEEGTYLKSEMLQRMHPDVATIVEKYGRWHHYVNYDSFRKLPLHRADELEIAPENDEYGMYYEVLDGETWVKANGGKRK